MTTAAEVLEIQHTLMERFTSWDMVAYISSFMATTAGKERATYRVSFYPWALEDATRAPQAQLDGEARKFCQAGRASLQRAQTYQVSPEMCALARALAENREPGVITAVQRQEMPAKDGFIWLDTSWLVQDVHDRTISHRAISWTTTTVHLDDGDGVPRLTDAVRLCWWTDTEDHAGDEYYASGFTEEMRAGIKRRIGRLSLSHVLVCPFDIHFTRKHAGDALLAALHTLWMLFDMEITAQERPKLDRAARRRVRGLHEPSVRVITLRRSHSAEEPGHQSQPVDWSCQWIVQGHGRHLEPYEGARHQAALDHTGHCTRCGARGTWVRPYIKGPGGMPLKITAAVVHRLSR